MTASMSNSKNPNLMGSLAALASVLIWSGWIVFTRHGVTTDVPAVTLGLLRYAIPTLVMLPLLLRSMTAYRKAGWLKCAIMVCGSGAPFFLICSLGMTFAPAAHVGVMLPGVMPIVRRAVLGSAVRRALRRGASVWLRNGAGGCARFKRRQPAGGRRR